LTFASDGLASKARRHKSSDELRAIHAFFYGQSVGVSPKFRFALAAGGGKVVKVFLAPNDLAALRTKPNIRGFSPLGVPIFDRLCVPRSSNVNHPKPRQKSRSKTQPPMVLTRVKVLFYFFHNQNPANGLRIFRPPSGVRPGAQSPFLNMVMRSSQRPIQVCFRTWGEKFFGNCVQMGTQLHIWAQVAILSLRAITARACAHFACNTRVIRKLIADSKISRPRGCDQGQKFWGQYLTPSSRW